MKNFIKKTIFILFLVTMLTACTKEPVSQNSFLLNTVISITIYDVNEKEGHEIIQKAFALGTEYEKILSKTIEDSEISKINSSNGQWVTVSDETIEIIKLSVEYGKLSDGAFDVTIAPVTEIWDFTAENPKVPNLDEIENELEFVGIENIEINGNKVRLLNPNAAIDLGGIAKGFIADEMKELLINEGVERGIINLGGNILTINTKSGEDSFDIGIQKPFDPTGSIAAVIEADNLSIVTSGTYQRYFEENGEIYHHILNTETGVPVRNGLISSTVITENSAVADALSTVTFVLGEEKGLELIEEIPNTEVVFIKEDFTYVHSSGIGTDINFQWLD